MGLIAIYVGGAVFIWAVVHAALFYALGWRGGIKYWLTACGLIPLAFVAYGLYLLLSFVPPATYDPDLPDPGPLNFANSLVLGFLPAFAYLIISTPLSAFALRSFRFK